MESQRFQKSDRLRKQAEFTRVYHSQVFAADEVLVITAVGNELEKSRLGLSVSKKVGNAVVRNQWKRRIREAFRLQRSKLPKGIDFVVRPRKGATCDFHRIQKSLASLLKRIESKLK